MNGKNNERALEQKLKAETRKAENPKGLGGFGATPKPTCETVAAPLAKVLPHEELLTAEEVAALLRVTVRTVERWQQEGVLPYLRMGHAVRFHWPTVVSHLLANFAVCKVRGALPIQSPKTQGRGA